MVLKNIFPFAVILVFFAACQDKTNVEIKGTIKNAPKQAVYLEQLNVDGPIAVDSAETNKKGQFTFKTNVTSPTFYQVKVGKNENITFLAEPEDKIELSGTLNGLTQNYWVDGSEHSLWIKLLNFQLHHSLTAMDSLKKMYTGLPQEKEYDTERKRVALEWDSVRTRQINFSRDFILKHAISPASYYALYQKFDADNFILEPATDLHSYKVVASSLKAMYPESQYTKALLKHLSQINHQIQSLKIQQLIANSENTLPEVKLPDASGDTIALSSLKGKYVVLDFTVLSSKNADSYVKDMKKVYDAFRNRGVQIYQVCLDPNLLLWKRLVKQYDINWICVRDGDGLHSRVAQSWNVKTVPANYIISPKSEIVGKNLTGQRLADRLNDLLKQSGTGR